MPEGTPESALRQPTSSQCFSPAGAPLYPVARTRLSFTRTAPTLRLRHVDLLDTSRVMPMKYSGQEGLFTPDLPLSDPDIDRWGTSGKARPLPAEPSGGQSPAQVAQAPAGSTGR